MTFSVNGNTVITSSRIVQLTTGATASRPASPVVGQIFFDTTLSKVIVWNGAVWREARSLPAVEIPSTWTWGYNGFGQLGDGTTTDRSSPVSVVGGFTDWVQISGGGNTTAALGVNGQAWTWGNNASGQLGDNTTTSRLSPVSVVGGVTNWTQISAGSYHTTALRSDGTAWGWGANAAGQLGDNTTTNRSSPVLVVGGVTNWLQISAGGNFTAAIRANGTAWCWGENFDGRLGNGSTTNRSSPVLVIGGFTDWVQISAGATHTGAVRANGQAWCWGASNYAQLGAGNFTGRSSPVLVVGGFTDWIQISAGNGHTAAIRANGQAWCWGRNTDGRLGDGTTSTRNSPVSVVGGFTDWVQISAGSTRPANMNTGAVRANGTAWCWGNNVSGQLGDNTTTTHSSPVSVVGGFTDWVQIVVGNKAIALRSQPRTQTVRPTNQRNTLV